MLSDEEFEAQRARILDESFGLSEAATEPGSGERSAEPPPAGRLEPATDLESPGGDVAPPRRSALHPGRWPDWLRIVLTAASGIWIVTIPLMFWRAARFTWLPYLGAATIAVAALLVAVDIVGADLGDVRRRAVSELHRSNSTEYAIRASGADTLRKRHPFTLLPGSP